MAQYRIRNKQPQLSASAFVAAEATLIGEVLLGDQASVWPGAVIRGDNEPIRLGAGTNVQEGAVLHADTGFPLVVGNRVTVGHQAMLHGCTIGDDTLIGIQAVVMNGAVIGRNSIVGAGTLVPEGKIFPDRSVIMGSPGKVVRQMTDEDVARIAASAAGYMNKTVDYRSALMRID